MCFDLFLSRKYEVSEGFDNFKEIKLIHTDAFLTGIYRVCEIYDCAARNEVNVHRRRREGVHLSHQGAFYICVCRKPRVLTC